MTTDTTTDDTRTHTGTSAHRYMSPRTYGHECRHMYISRVRTHRRPYVTRTHADPGQAHRRTSHGHTRVRVQTHRLYTYTCVHGYQCYNHTSVHIRIHGCEGTYTRTHTCTTLVCVCEYEYEYSYTRAPPHPRTCTRLPSMTGQSQGTTGLLDLPGQTCTGRRPVSGSRL